MKHLFYTNAYVELADERIAQLTSYGLRIIEGPAGPISDKAKALGLEVVGLYVEVDNAEDRTGGEVVNAVQIEYFERHRND